MADVDFVINCYERTYRDVLNPGFMAARVAEQSREFSAVTVLINNVDDRADAERRAKLLLRTDEATRVEFVADHLDAAFRKTRVRPGNIRRLPHFTDCCLVAVTLGGPDWIVYWDADARLRDRCDWVTPTLEYMQSIQAWLSATPTTGTMDSRCERLRKSTKPSRSDSDSPM